MSIGLLYERQGQYVKAAESYEIEVADEINHPPIDSYINLAFLYWSFAFIEFDFNVPNNIPGEWTITGGERFALIIEKGLKAYPNALELAFWKRYFAHIIYSEEFTLQDCEQLMLNCNSHDSLIPYYFLNLFDNEKYSIEWNLLWESVKDVRTAKNLYLKSVMA